MTSELFALTLAALLQVVQYALYAVPANIELGVGYTSSSRDRAPTRQVSPVTARLLRAFNNHFESLALFTIAVLVVTLAQKTSQTTQYAAYTYVGARVLYIPAYAFGLNPWRSAIWFVGFFAILTLLITALL